MVFNMHRFIVFSELAEAKKTKISSMDSANY